jgi:hypothetical protein
MHVGRIGHADNRALKDPVGAFGHSRCRTNHNGHKGTPGFRHASRS